MTTDPIDNELIALKQRALAGDIGEMRLSYERGELQWLRNRMTPERYAHLGLSLQSGNLESVRSDLATVATPVEVITTSPIDADGAKREFVLQSQRNGLIAGAVIVALALLGLIGFLTLRNNDKASVTTVVVSTSAETVPDTTLDTISADTVPLETITPSPVVPDTVPATLVSPSTVLAGVATTLDTQTTLKRTVPAITTSDPSVPSPITVAGARKSDVLSVAERSATFGPFLAMIDAAGLREEILALNPSTVLAPTESAFSVLPLDVQAALKSPANKAVLTRIVRYNVIPQAITLAQFTTADLKSVEGSTLSVVVGNNTVAINDAKVTGSDVQTITGVLHAIDKVLLPPGVNLNALVARPVPTATTPPQTTPPTTQPLPTTVSATQPPPPTAIQVPQSTSTVVGSTTIKAP